MTSSKKNLYLFFVFIAIFAVKSNASISLPVIAKLTEQKTSILSSFKPVSMNFLPWVSSVDAAPYYEPSRHLVFTGSADNYLYVVDADDMKIISKIDAKSRVITKPLPIQDGKLLVFGTLEGYLYVIDAYNYQTKGVFLADSSINNNLLFFENRIYFSTKTGSFYALDFKNYLNCLSVFWHVEKPSLKTKINLTSNSNIVVYKNTFENINYVLFPHFNGSVYMINVNNGVIKKEFKFSSSYTDFSDIVAPMVIVDNLLYVSSYSLGLFKINLVTSQVSQILIKENLKEIIQLSYSDQGLIAASHRDLFLISYDNILLWNNDFSSIKLKSPAYGNFFKDVKHYTSGLKGGISKINIYNSNIIIASEMGGIAVFDSKTGMLKGIKGGLTGFGPKIEFYDGLLFCISRMGNLFKYIFI